MRLIDADELKKELYQDWFLDILLTQQSKIDIFHTLEEKIDKLCTSYDVNNVVAEISALNTQYLLELFNTVNEKDDYAYIKVGSALDKAIEIIKRGGSN